MVFELRQEVFKRVQISCSKASTQEMLIAMTSNPFHIQDHRSKNYRVGGSEMVKSKTHFTNKEMCGQRKLVCPRLYSQLMNS